MKLFTKDPRILTIEINDKKINEDLCHLIIKLETNIQELQRLFESSDNSTKNEKIAELQTMIHQLKQDVVALHNDVDAIEAIELQEKEYLMIKDSTFLKDKLSQLDIMKKHVETIEGILLEHPSSSALQGGLIQDIIKDLNTVIDGINRIRADDKALEKIYQAVSRV